MIEKHCRDLERISKLPGLGEEEVNSVKIAALALHYLYAENKLARFLEYVETTDSELSEEEISKLKCLGLEP